MWYFGVTYRGSFLVCGKGVKHEGVHLSAAFGDGVAPAATSSSGSLGGEGGAGPSASHARSNLRERGALKSALKSPAPASPANPKPPDDLYA